MHVRDIQENEIDSLYNALLHSAMENGTDKRFNQDKEVLRNAIFQKKHYGRIEFALLKTNRIGELFLERLSFKEIEFIKPIRLTLTNS